MVTHACKEDVAADWHHCHCKLHSCLCMIMASNAQHGADGQCQGFEVLLSRSALALASSWGMHCILNRLYEGTNGLDQPLPDIITSFVVCGSACSLSGVK